MHFVMIMQLQVLYSCNAQCQCVAYLCASEGFHFPILNAGSSLAYVHGVVKEGLVFVGKLLRPVPNRREIHGLILPLRDSFILGKVLQSKDNIITFLTHKLNVALSMCNTLHSFLSII